MEKLKMHSPDLSQDNIAKIRELFPGCVTEARGEDGSVKLAVDLKWPIADQLLMRADSVAFPPGGCAYLHTHQGSGIRCLIEGGMRKLGVGPGADLHHHRHARAR